MPKVRHAHIIEAPLPVVWAALNDIDHTPEWVVGLERAEVVSPEPFGRGSIYIDYNRLGPFPQKTVWGITEFEPYVCQVHVSTSKIIPSTLTMGLSLAPKGVHVEMTIDFQFLPRFGALGRFLGRTLMTRMIGQVIAQNLENLNQRLKQRAPLTTHTDTYAAVRL
jgi:hypothetical protein